MSGCSLVLQLLNPVLLRLLLHRVVVKTQKVRENGAGSEWRESEQVEGQNWLWVPQFDHLIYWTCWIEDPCYMLTTVEMGK